MASRKTILATNEYYHIFNRGARDIPIFKNKLDYSLFLETAKFYLQPKPATRFSFYKRQKKKYPINLTEKLVNIVAYCLMPNHFHFILRQEKENGIKQFMQKLSNSYAHYFNLKYKGRGPVLEGNFKAVHINTEEQLLHLSRYIHLNPVTAFLVEKPQDYPYSSYGVYLKKAANEIVDFSAAMSSNKVKGYKEFVSSRKDYQRELDRIKHLVLE